MTTTPAAPDEEPVTVLSDDQCWEALRSAEFGRLAYVLGDEINLVPVNYVVDETSLLFRTAEGSKLLGVVMHPEVVFEIDRYDAVHAESVIVRGRARQLEEDEEHRIDDLPLHPWVDTLKYNVVEITPHEVSGRRFRLHRS